MRNGETSQASGQDAPSQASEVPNWDDFEDGWNQAVALARADEDNKLQDEFIKEAGELRTELVEAIAQHTRLTEALLQARVLVDEKHADMDWLQDQFNRQRSALAEQRKKDDLRIKAWIIHGRNAQAGGHTDSMNHGSLDIRTRQSTDPHTDDRQNGSDGAPLTRARERARNRDRESQDVPNDQPPPFVREESSKNSLARATSPTKTIGELAGVEIINPAGALVGTVKRINAENHWIQKLLDLPIRRRVEIRMGRKFTQSQLDTIYTGNDQKRSKWLSVMIQATGELQQRACQTCAKGQGLYSLCIIVGGSDFPRCGNCEWNKQGCHGAHGSVVRSAESRGMPTLKQQILGESQPSQQQQHTPQQADSPSLLYARAGVPGTANTNGWDAVDSFKENLGQTSLNVKESTRRSRVREQQPPSTPQRIEPSVKNNSPLVTAKGEEITSDTLALKDDGMIFLEPEIMRGVPLRKIGPDDAYWEPQWQPIEEPIQTKLNEWKDKLEVLRKITESALTEKDRTAIFQAGRQVNRGKTTMNFLQNCDFHPFQLIGKQWIAPSLVHYDTLFRMVATLEELAKFRIDVTPLQWLRQRLYEIYSANTKDFKLDRVVAKMYHDPKLAELRSKNGFGNIGRPSTNARSRDSMGGTPLQPKSGDKRKEAPGGSGHSATASPSKRLFAKADQQAGQEGGGKEPKSSKHPQSQKQQDQAASAAPSPASVPGSFTHRRRSQPAGRKPASAKQREAAPTNSGFVTTGGVSSQTYPDDLECSGYTSTDSLTRDPVVKKDWRVYQVKTMHLTSNPSTTQYWHWVDEKDANKTSGPGGPEDCEPMFEHQVLKETEPETSWGVFKEPVDFHLRLRELTNIAYARDSPKIVIGTRQVEGVERRGNVLAHFKRERTKRRFLAFMHKQGIDLVRTQGEVIEEEWSRMKSDVMPGGDSE